MKTMFLFRFVQKTAKILNNFPITSSSFSIPLLTGILNNLLKKWVTDILKNIKVAKVCPL